MVIFVNKKCLQNAGVGTLSNTVETVEAQKLSSPRRAHFSTYTYYSHTLASTAGGGVLSGRGFRLKIRLKVFCSASYIDIPIIF